MFAHLVADSTASSRYFAELRRWLMFILEFELACSTWDDLDRAAARYIAYSCILQGAHPSVGDQLPNGLGYLFPTSDGCFARAWRCLKVWHRIHIHGQGGPLPVELLRWMEDLMNSWAEYQCADMVALAVDSYLLGQDLLSIRVGDLSFVDGELAIRLGVSARGESAKTGRDQGVRVDHVEVMELILKRAADIVKVHGAKKAALQPLFTVTQDKYRRVWNAAAEHLGIHNPPPPHTARHSGPSRDAATGHRSLAQIQRRGRWSSDRSVLRYAKTAEYLSSFKLVPTAVIERGAMLLCSRVRPQQPRE